MIKLLRNFQSRLDPIISSRWQIKKRDVAEALLKDKGRKGMALRTRLRNYIESLKEEGVLDSQYDHVKSLQPENDPCFILDIINNFCDDADHSIRELANVLSEPVVDYPKVITYVCLLKGSSSSIGGCRMAVSCRQLHDASVNGDLASCCIAYDKLVNDYYYLRDKLKTVHQMERTILHNEERKKK